MARSDSLGRELAQLASKEASLHGDLVRHERDAQRYRADAASKMALVARTKSVSTATSYQRSADSAAKKAIDAEKKVADVKRKLATASKAKATKTQQLRQAEEAERKQRSQASERQMRKERQHARQIAAISVPQVRHVVLQAPKPEKLRVLYLTSNPAEDSYLRTEAEVRSVQQELRGALHRDLVEVHIRPAAGSEDILQGINDIRPHIVHFSGHGGGSEILLDSGDVEAPEGIGMNYQTLAAFLSATDEPPVLLVLNACDTLDGVDELLPAVPAVIAMSASISDAAASIFAAKFYAAIASAQSLGASLKQGKAMLTMISSAEADLPQCIARPDIDIDDLVLVTPPST